MFSIIIAYKNKEYKTVRFVKLGLDGNETAMSCTVFFFLNAAKSYPSLIRWGTHDLRRL